MEENEIEEKPINQSKNDIKKTIAKFFIIIGGIVNLITFCGMIYVLFNEVPEKVVNKAIERLKAEQNNEIMVTENLKVNLIKNIAVIDSILPNQLTKLEKI